MYIENGRLSETNISEPRSDIQLGIGFKPFKGVRNFHHVPKDKTFDVPEDYPHYLFLRKKVSLHGIPGLIDVVSEDPTSFIDKLALIANTSKYRLFCDQPLGQVDNAIKYSGSGKYEPTDPAAILRFSFLLKNPNQYARLLTTYCVVDLGKDKFLLNFDLNQLAIKRGLQALESGKRIIVAEKNLFNLGKLENLKQEKASADGEAESSELELPEKDQGDPGRIAFVHLPKDIKKLRTINVTFYRYNDWGKPEEYPTEPLQPNLQPIPILA